jgi:hypothetical protein
VLDVDVQVNAREPFARQVRERVAEQRVAAARGVGGRVREDGFTASLAHIELHYVDPDRDRCVGRRERVGGRRRPRTTVSDPLEALRRHRSHDGGSGGHA